MLVCILVTFYGTFLLIMILLLSALGRHAVLSHALIQLRLLRIDLSDDAVMQMRTPAAGPSQRRKIPEAMKSNTNILANAHLGFQPHHVSAILYSFPFSFSISVVSVTVSYLF